MRIRILFAILISLSIISCEEVPEEKIEIITGRVCGWCAEADSLSLTSETTKYRVSNPCSHETIYSTDEATDSKTWNELIELLDWDKFNDVTISTCNICVDGCDTFVKINYGFRSHNISFGGTGDPELESIKEFLDKLDEVKTYLWTRSHLKK